jgi:hypothetical protein
MTARAPARGSARWLGLALGIVPPVLLWWWQSAGQTPDGLSYLLDIRSGTQMWHPHHLVYVPVARALHSLGGLTPLAAGLVQNLAALPLLAWAAHGVARRLLPGPWQPWAAVGALLATRGVLFYATHIETYLPALAWSAVTLRLALDLRPRTLLLAGALVLAVLYHQTNVLLVAPLLAMAGTRRAELRRIAGVSLLAAAVVLVAYLAAWRSDAAGTSFVDFVTTYARAAVPSWGRWDNFGPHGLLSLGLSQSANLAPTPKWLAAPMLLAIAALAIWHLRRLRAPDDDLAPLRRFALGMLLCYLAFFLWWMPQDSDFFLATVLPLWVLALMLWRDLGAGPRARWVPAAAAVVLFAVNFGFTVLPLHRDPGPDHAAALALHASTPASAVLVVGYAAEQELLYYTERVAVYAGTAFCQRAFPAPPAGHAADTSPEPVLVVAGDFLQDLLAGRTGLGEECLARLVDFDAVGGRCRAYAPRPDGGLDVFPAWRPAESIAAVLDEVRRTATRALGR